MYQQTNNSTQQRPFPAQRAKINRFLVCTYLIFLIYAAIHFMCLIYLVTSGDTQHIYPNTFFVVYFFISAIRTKDTQVKWKKGNTTFKALRKSVNQVMIRNCVVIFINIAVLFITFVVLVAVYLHTSSFNYILELWGIIALVDAVAMIPFYFLISRQKAITECLYEMDPDRPIPNNGHASFTNQSQSGDVSLSQQGYAQQLQPFYAQQAPQGYSQAPQPVYAAARGFNTNENPDSNRITPNPFM